MHYKYQYLFSGCGFFLISFKIFNRALGREKYFYFHEVQFNTFYILWFIFCILFKKLLLSTRLQNTFSYFPFRNFIVLTLYFSQWNLVNFCVWCEVRFKVYHFFYHDKKFHHHLLKDYSFLIGLSWHFGQKLFGHIWGSLFLDFIVFSMYGTIYQYHSFLIIAIFQWIFKSGRVKSSNLVLFYDCFYYSTEKVMAPHSGTLAWRIPGTGEPGGLPSMGLWRVRHDWTTSLSLLTFMHWRRKRQPTPMFLPGESQGWGSLVGCRLWGHTGSDTTEAT